MRKPAIETVAALNPYGYLQDLQTSVGARVAGTAGEAQAQHWLEQQIRALGLVPELMAFQYQPETWLTRARSLGIALGMVALTLLSLVVNPWLILLGIVIVLVVFGPVWRRLERNSAQQIGHNVIAGVSRPWSEIVAAPRDRLLFVCAHYDTAPTMPAWRSRLSRMNDSIAGLAFLGVVGLAFYCLVSGTLSILQGSAGWAAVWATIVAHFWQQIGVWLVFVAGLPGTVVVLLSALSYQPSGRRPENPGADDNGSGVAVMLGITGQVKQTPLPGWDVVAAFWDAEESGLWGSDAFVETYGSKLDPANTVIINVDTVGRGECLMAVAGQGVLRRQAVDETLLQAWERSCKSVAACTIREWLTPLTGSSDHAAWLNADFRKAISIGRGDLVPIALPTRMLNKVLAVPTGQKQTDVSHIHSADDSLNRIRPGCLQETAAAIWTLMRSL